MQQTRAPLSPDSLVTVCRELLNEGGPEAIVVREVARRAGVTAPALYKHVQGRQDLLTQLIVACNDEVADVCAYAADSYEPQDYPAQLLGASAAFRDWALANKPEFGLIYGTPIPQYVAPVGGPTTESSRRFGAVFARIYLGLLGTGRLRLVDPTTMSAALIAALQSRPIPGDHELTPEAAYQFAVGWHRLLGMVSVEVAGHLDWIMDDSSDFVRRQMTALGEEMILPT